MKYLRQSAVLTAFGDPVFENFFANIAVIHLIFRRAIGELLDSTAQQLYSEHPVTIDVANCYFVPKANALPEDICMLTSEVDPLEP